MAIKVRAHDSAGGNGDNSGKQSCSSFTVPKRRQERNLLRYTIRTMPRILNITNGDSAVSLMKEGRVPGDYLPWRDVLHDGPVPDILDLYSLSEVRSKFIASRNWGALSDIAESFRLRDKTLESFQQYDKITLWFEHDLYDQLQILQILDWFHHREMGQTTLSMVCTEQYLGHLTPLEISAHIAHEAPVSRDQLVLAHRAWSAFRQDTPKRWIDLLEHETITLPYLHGAIERMLEEFPDSASGLSRTARETMILIENDAVCPDRLFGLYQNTEERIFMGDLSYWNVLQELLMSSLPLIRLSNGGLEINPGNQADTLSLTPEGRAALNGEYNWMDHHCPDRWIGGVHLTRDNLWFWDKSSKSIFPGK